MSADNTTAIHEAGHVVAHLRLGIEQGRVTIEPHDGLLGSVLAAGIKQVWDGDEASKQAIAYCSGYAALVVAGYDQQTALAGADDDFEKTQYLMKFWGLEGGIAESKERAIKLMIEPQNVAAVRLIADWLKRERVIEGDLHETLVDLSDGNCSQAEFDRYLLLIDHARRDGLVD